MASPNRIIDLALLLVMIATQVIIARLFLPGWRNRLSMPWRAALTALMWLLWAVVAADGFLTIVSDLFALNWIPSIVKSLVMAVGMIWGLATTASLVLWWLFSMPAKLISPEHAPGRRQLLLTAGRISVAAPFALSAYGFVKRNNFEVKEVVLPVPGLHPDLEGLRIGQLSDLHVSPYLSVRELGRAVDMMNELRPNLIAVTGDLITRWGDPLDGAIRELARLRAEAGVFGCMGNHEEYARVQAYVTAEAARYGMDFLTFEARQLRFGQAELNIGGVDYQNSRNRRRYLAGAETLVVPGATNLLLSHNPDVFPAAVRQGWNTMLSGHTHGGQVTVEILNQTLNVARFVTPYVAGLYRLGGASCYVNSGLGTIAMPVRLGAPPEITLLRLTRAEGPANTPSTVGGSSMGARV